MTPSVYVCITTGTGNIRNDVMAAAMAACERAQRSGIVIGLGRQQYQYGIATCRNKAVAAFLQYKQFSHLLFVDDDVIVPPNTVVDLVETASQPDRAIVAGPYPSVKFTTSRHAYLYVAVTKLQSGLATWYEDWPEGIEEVGGAGTGCLLIARSVFGVLGYPWFRWPERLDEATGTVQCISDDMDFCDRAGKAGFRIWADGRVRCGHLKLLNVASLMDGSISWRQGETNVPDGYGSHVPVLRDLAKVKPIRVVVEYGSGRHSTPLFLNREVYPNLERLVSVECNHEWAEDTRQRNQDGRLEMVLCPIADTAEYPAPAADLVFIDCDTVNGDKHDFSMRTKLIEKYASDQQAMIVVHDANFTSIRPAIEAAPYRYKIVHYPESGPHTAVLSNAVDVRTLFGVRG